MNRLWLGVTISALTGLAACSGCPNMGGTPDGAIPVMVQSVTERDSSSHVTAFGVVMASNRSDIIFPYAVKVDKVFVHLGDTIAAATPLFKLSDEDITVRLNQLRASKKESEAGLEKLRYLMQNRDKLLEETKLTKTQYDGLDTEVKANDASLERIKTDIAAAEYTLNNLTVPSPIAGQVIALTATPGMVYNPKDLLASVATLNPLTMVFPIAADDAPGVTVGTPVTIKLEDLPATPLASTMSYLGPTLAPSSKTFDAWAVLPNADGVLKINMKGTVEFNTNVIHKVFAVPLSSLTLRERDATLFVVKNRVARKVTVTVREMTPTEAILGTGVQDGDLVVAKGWEKLQDGSPVDLRH